MTHINYNLSSYKKNLSCGFTLIESMATIAIAAILVAIAVPSFQTMIERGRVKSLAEFVYANLQYAKSEVIKANSAKDVYVTFKTGATPQCFGIIKGKTACDCSNDNTVVCDKKVTINDLTFPSAELNNDGEFTIQFDSIRGTATGKTVIIKSKNNSTIQLKIVVSILGRIRICATNDNIPGYKKCQ